MGVIDMFTDVQFMTAKGKELVLKNWKTFLQHSLKKEHFTKRLYNHLHLHCGFIAHYDIHGFYATYFEAGQDTEKFFEHFCNYSAQNYGANADYDDLNTAMRQVYDEFKAKILTTTEADINHSLDVLEACIKMAREDEKFARQFLSKVRI
ncbi:MAG: hypothetical protein MUO97_11865 [Dehalococcoidia bacterium]|nr:hypothetical protein [Dehalococcoidia bacterium]